MPISQQLQTALGERKLTKAERQAREEPGGSNVGRYKGAGKFAGPAGGAPKGSFPIDTRKRAKAALAYARHAPNPAGIRKAVCKAYPDFESCKVAEDIEPWDGEWTTEDVEAILEWLMIEHDLDLENVDFEMLQARLSEEEDGAELAVWIGDALDEGKKEKRYVYGTRSKKWHLVGPDDRDYAHAIPQDEFKRLGPKRAKEKYLQARLL